MSKFVRISIKCNRVNRKLSFVHYDDEKLEIFDKKYKKNVTMKVMFLMLIVM